MTWIYKILTRAEWDAALATGRYDGSVHDARDGFIHMSAAGELAETARKYFSGQQDLLLVTLESDALGSGLVWEPSRGGALFPHLYGPLHTASAIDVRSLDLGPDGVPVIDLLP